MGLLFDPAVNIWLQQLSAPWLDVVMRLFTELGDQYFYMALLPFIYWCVDRRKGHELGYLFLVSIWLNGLLKDLFNMPRPSATEGVRIVIREYSNGFPSGHAQGSMTAFGYLFAAFPARWLRALAVLMIVLISGSRLYLGVHYLADLVGGWAVGLALLLLFRHGFARGWGDRWPRPLKLALALAGPLLLVPLYSGSVTYLVLGFLMGFLASDLYAFEAVPFTARVDWPRQVAKLALGFAGFAVLYVLHGLLIPNGILELPGYALLGVWVTTGAPWLFRRLGLAGPVAGLRGGPLAGPEGRAPATLRPVLAGAVAAVLLIAVGTVAAQPPVAAPALPALATGTGETARPLVIAHQGGDGLRPGNTLEAFRNGLAVGADWLEMDVHLTADGQVVVIHDETVDRTTDGTGDVHAMTLAELQRLDAGYDWSPDGGRSFPYRGRGLRIPTLDEVMTAFPGVPLLIELKDDDPRLAEAVARLIAAHGAAGRVMINSFHDGVLRHFRTLAPDVATGLPQGEALRFTIAQRLGLWNFLRPAGYALQVPEWHGRLKVVSPGFVRAAHDRGLAVQVWTVNDPRDMERLLSYGVDGLITDYPDRARAVVDALAGR